MVTRRASPYPRAVQLRRLGSLPEATIHGAFIEAFADYVVPLRPELDAFRDLHTRCGVRPDLSIGAFEGERLIGFTLSAFGAWEGRRAGYDAGTGVIPSARRRGLARAMMRRSLELLAAEGATCCVLEVIQSNLGALELYRDLGFEHRRDLLCWRLDEVPYRRVAGLELRGAQRPHDLDLDLDRDAAPLWSRWPSWQNSIASIHRTREAQTTLVARLDDKLVGYAVVLRRGNLLQLAVAPEMRRRGIGTALLRAARLHAAGPLALTNTDAEDRAMTAFLESLGAEERVRQHEMLLEF